MLAKEDNDLFERITLEINIFLYLQEEKKQDLVQHFYRFLIVEIFGHTAWLLFSEFSTLGRESQSAVLGRGLEGWGLRFTCSESIFIFKNAKRTKKRKRERNIRNRFLKMNQQTGQCMH